MVELMVAIAVLAIILVIAAKMLSNAASLFTANNKHMDANDQARAVFDRMADDFDRIVKRKDVDYIFWKNAGNDAMYFYTEGDSYFDSSTFNTVPSGVNYSEAEKNEPSLVGYRVNNIAASTYPSGANPDYYQLERLGKPLAVDSGAYNGSEPSNNSQQPNVMVYLSYPPAGYDVINGGTPQGYKDPSKIPYSSAYFCSTLAGAFSNSGNSPAGNLPSAVGSYPGANASSAFNDSMDTAYHSIGSQVFRFEYSFQLKDGTLSDKPVMVYSAASGNGVPSSNITATQRPLPTNDSSSPGGGWAIGSRWWDKTNQIGYICLDATPNYAVWHEIGIQDIAAIIVTIAVIDKQGLTFIQQNGIDLANVAAQLPDYDATTTVAGGAAGDPAYLLNPSVTTSWAYKLLPGSSGMATTMSGTKLPQTMVSQIRIYQRYFYLNSY